MIAAHHLFFDVDPRPAEQAWTAWLDRVLASGELAAVVPIARYLRSAGNPDVADPGSATTIMVIEHSAAPNHNGGQLQFGGHLEKKSDDK